MLPSSSLLCVWVRSLHFVHPVCRILIGFTTLLPHRRAESRRRMFANIVLTGHLAKINGFSSLLEDRYALSSISFLFRLLWPYRHSLLTRAQSVETLPPQG